MHNAALVDAREGSDAGANGSVGAGRSEAALDCICFNLRKTTRAVTRMFDEALRPSDLKATQFSLLAAAESEGPITIKQLADATVMDRTTLTRNLRPLERRGLIQIRPGRDRRQRVVSLTDQGRERFELAYPVWERTHARIAAALGDERLQRLRGDLRVGVEVSSPD